MPKENFMPADSKTTAQNIPFALRAGASISDCVLGAGVSRTYIYQLMRSGEVEYVKNGRGTIVKVPSLLKRLGLIDTSTAA
jgi:hypothetical protein